LDGLGIVLRNQRRAGHGRGHRSHRHAGHEDPDAGLRWGGVAASEAELDGAEHDDERAEEG